MINIILLISFISLGIVIFGLLRQKDVFTKLLFMNIATSLTALFICFMGVFKTNNSYIDIALIYFLLGVTGNIAYLKYFSKNDTK